MINEKRKTCSASDVQFVASYFAGWICAGDLSYAARCLRKGLEVLFVYSETNRIMVVPLDPKEGEFCRSPFLKPGASKSKENNREYKHHLDRKPGHMPYFAVMTGQKTTSQAYYAIAEALRMLVNPKTYANAMLYGLNLWPMEYIDDRGKRTTPHGATSDTYQTRHRLIRKMFEEVKAARLAALPEEKRNKIEARRLKAQAKKDETKAKREASKLRADEIASAKRMQRQAANWRREVARIDKLLARKSGKFTTQQIRDDLKAQRETLLPLIEQMDTNAKTLEKDSQTFARSISQALKPDEKEKPLSELTIEKETSTKNPEVVRWHIRGHVGKIPVRGISHDFHRGIDRADRFDAIKTLIRTDGKPLPIAARLKVFHAINRIVEREATP